MGTQHVFLLFVAIFMLQMPVSAVGATFVPFLPDLGGGKVQVQGPPNSPGGEVEQQVRPPNDSDPPVLGEPMSPLPLATTHAVQAARTLRLVQAAARRLEGGLNRCRESDPIPEFHGCVADALDDYAEEISRPNIILPAPLQEAPRIVSQTAARIRVAPTTEIARAEVRAAITEVHKSIELIKAEEPRVEELQIRTGNTIEASLELVDTTLARAIGL